MKYSHIVFDVDGTLIDTENANLLSLRDVVKELLNQDLPINELRFAFSMTSNNALDRLGVKDFDRANYLWQKYYKNYEKDVTVFDGIQEALKQIKSKSCSLGIITSRTKAEYQNDFAPFGISRYFDVVVCADDTTNHKPHSEPMEKLLERANGNAKTTLYVGDTVYDMQCAQGAGVDFALALWGCKNPEVISATYRLSSPLQIIDL